MRKIITLIAIFAIALLIINGCANKTMPVSKGQTENVDIATADADATNQINEEIIDENSEVEVGEVI